MEPNQLILFEKSQRCISILSAEIDLLSTAGGQHSFAPSLTPNGFWILDNEGGEVRGDVHRDISGPFLILVQKPEINEELLEPAEFRKVERFGVTDWCT